MELRIRVHYRVREKLRKLCGGSTPARVAKRARILLFLHTGRTVAQVAEIAGAGTATVKRVRRRYLDQGWETAIGDAPRPGRPKKLKSREEKELIALACTDPPGNASRWTIRLLAKHFRKDVSVKIVHRVLKEDGLKPWREKNVVRSRARRTVQNAHV